MSESEHVLNTMTSRGGKLVYSELIFFIIYAEAHIQEFFADIDIGENVAGYFSGFNASTNQGKQRDHIVGQVRINGCI